MKDLLKNKPVLIAAGVVVLLVLVGGLFLLTSKKSSVSQDNQNANVMPTEIPVPTITAGALGLVLKSGLGGKTVVVSAQNTQGISSMEFNLTYMALVNGEKVLRGGNGSLDLTKKPASKEITLGTCSDVCHYDVGVADIKVIVKITKTDGKVYQSEISLPNVTE